MSKIPLALLALALLSIPLQGLTASHSVLPPSRSDVVIAYDSAIYLGGHDWQHGSDVAVDVGQTFFLAGSIELDRITVKFQAQSDISRELVTLWIGSYTDANDSTMNELMHVEMGVLPSDLPADSPRYLTLDLANPIVLEGNAQYGFVLGFTGGGGVNHAWAELLHMGTDIYAGGQAITEFGSTIQALSEDLIFFVATSIDPATVIFLDGFETGDTNEWSDCLP